MSLPGLDVEQRRLTRVAAYALVLDEDERILLVRVAQGYSGAGRWTLPGGGINFGEDPADAVLRELAEETGLVGEVERLEFVDSQTGPGDPERGFDVWHVIRTCYRVRTLGGGLCVEDDESTDLAQ
jgi:ADP-ribose pyrophosphatase YjhB (NUDIX family)